MNEKNKNFSKPQCMLASGDTVDRKSSPQGSQIIII